MRTMLKVIANDNAKNSRLESWYKHIEETGMFLSSQLPPLALSHRREQPLTIEMLCFDTPVRMEDFSQISQHSFVVAEDLTVLDFGQQEWTLPHMQILLRWCAPSLKRVMLCKLANASFSLEAFRYLVDFLAKHAISIDALDIGTMHMSLPRVELLGRLCTDKAVALKKLDFGHSRWEMSHMKALMWSFAHKGYHLERLALSAIECPAVGLDLLIRHMLQISTSVRVFSTGVTPLSDKAHGLILKQLLRSELRIHACVLSYQSFNTENSALLAKVIACSALRSLALMHCQWYQDALVWPDTLAGVAKLYLEFSDGVCYEPLLTVLKARGYEVTKQADSAKRIWLERKS